MRTPQAVKGGPKETIGATFCPTEWERHAKLKDGTAIFIRPVHPEDERLYPTFFAAVTEQDLRLRFFAPIKDRSHEFFAHFTHLDYVHAMAFIALGEDTGDMLGVVRLHTSTDNEMAEFAILLRSDLKGRGLGWLLMQSIIEYARSRGLRRIEGQVLAENATMLRMCSEIGFQIAADPNEGHIRVVTLQLAP